MIMHSRPPTLNPLRHFNLTSTEASFALPFATRYLSNFTEHDSRPRVHVVFGRILFALSSAVANSIFIQVNSPLVLLVAASSCDIPTSNELVESSLQGGHFTQCSSSSSAPSAFLALAAWHRQGFHSKGEGIGQQQQTKQKHHRSMTDIRHQISISIVDPSITHACITGGCSQLCHSSQVTFDPSWCKSIEF